ncbi:MAG: FIVAR domain-containing protein [Coriobacteriales bacterium]|nr:FIVAR domain-containing protein [Coriobacteriales bacterium]
MFPSAYARTAANDNAATLLLAVTTSAITGVGIPVAGGTPATTVTETDQYTGTVTWSPSDVTFQPNTEYTATITLSAKPGYTFVGVGEDFFSVAGASATNVANTGTVTAAFPKTAPAKAALEDAIKDAKAIAHTFQTAASWDALQEAINQGEAVDKDPDATEAEVTSALTAIKDAIAAQYFDYPVMESFGTWSGTGPLSARINADVEYFSQLKLNGSPVAATNYTVTSGSTVLTLHEDYLKGLPAGTYSLVAEFSNGTSAPMTLKVAEVPPGPAPTPTPTPAPPDNGGGSGTVPMTGDSPLWAAALVAVLAAAAATSLALSRHLRRRPRRARRS